MTVETERARAIDACVAEIRAIIADQGVARAALESVKGKLLDLAARRDLFSFEAFPMLDEGSSMHRLSEDDDHGFALYAVASGPGRGGGTTNDSATPPHDHTTWAVIVGVEGEELNRLYRRVDDASEPGKAKLEPIGETVVRAGTGVALMPEDIHSIQRVGDQPMLHFHLYGRSIEHLPERKQFDLESGAYEVYPASPNIRK